MGVMFAALVCALVLILPVHEANADPAVDQAAKTQGDGAPDDRAAEGVTIVNGMSKDWTLTVLKGASRATHPIAAGKRLFGLCPDGCILRLEGAEDGRYTLEGNERLAIEDGVIYYDDGPAGGRQVVPGVGR